MLKEVETVVILACLLAALLNRANGQGTLTTSVPFTPVQQIEIVDRHNTARAKIGAADMTTMAWDPFLANFAQRQANRCDTAHSPITDRIRQGTYTYLGENNAWGNKGQLPDVGLIADKWEEESLQYTAGQPFPGGCAAGQICGHYTQMVWSTTCRIGCAGALCSFIANGDKVSSGYMVVCNYGNGGNIAGSLPYKTGTPCSACVEAGDCATTGLCGSATCPADPLASTLAPPVSTTIGPSCTNQHPLCPYWAQLGECTSNRFWMDHYCLGSCNECPKVVLSPEPACVDQEARRGECAVWNSTGLCIKYASYMSWLCRKTCGFCSPSSITGSRATGSGQLGGASRLGGLPPGGGVGPFRGPYTNTDVYNKHYGGPISLYQNFNSVPGRVFIPPALAAAGSQTGVQTGGGVGVFSGLGAGFGGSPPSINFGRK